MGQLRLGNSRMHAMGPSPTHGPDPSATGATSPACPARERCAGAAALRQLSACNALATTVGSQCRVLCVLAGAGPKWASDGVRAEVARALGQTVSACAGGVDTSCHTEPPTGPAESPRGSGNPTMRLAEPQSAEAPMRLPKPL